MVLLSLWGIRVFPLRLAAARLRRTRCMGHILFNPVDPVHPV